MLIVVVCDCLVTVRAVAQKINPALAFIPLVYHSQIQWAMPHSYVLGAPLGVPFVPPSRASVSLQMARPPPDTGARKMCLRFFYYCSISLWSERMQQQAGRKNTKPVKGLLLFEVTVNGQTILSVDASTVQAPSFFEVDVSKWCSYMPASGNETRSQQQPALQGVLSLSTHDNCSVNFSTRPTALAADPINAWLAKDVYRTSYVYGATIVDQSGTEGPLSPLHVAYESKGKGILARQPTEASLVGRSEAMIVQRSQNPQDMLPIADYALLMRSVKDANPIAQVYGGHYSRRGLIWDQPVSPTALAAGIRTDISVGLAGSLVWEMPLMVGRCRSRFDSCDEGVFHQRQLEPPSPHHHGPPLYNARLFWPNMDGILPGWFQRFTTKAAVPAGRPLRFALSDSLALRNGTNPVNQSHFRKRVVGLTSGTVFYDAPVARYANGSATCGEAETSCAGASGLDPGSTCTMNCSGEGMGLTTLTITVATDEWLFVELVTGSMGCTHCLMQLDVEIQFFLVRVVYRETRHDCPRTHLPHVVRLTSVVFVLCAMQEQMQKQFENTRLFLFQQDCCHRWFRVHMVDMVEAPFLQCLYMVHHRWRLPCRTCCLYMVQEVNNSYIRL